jgi:two-component system response regulator AtoC
MKSILIIDDDPLIRKTLSSHLSKKGFEVELAEDGGDGLKKFEECQPELVVLDIRLPDIDGLEVLMKLKEKNKNATIIIMTAYDDMKTTVEAIKLGAFEYLVKPLDNVELDLTISKAIQVRTLEDKLSQTLSAVRHR